MSAILDLFKLDFSNLIMSVFIVMAGMVAVYKIIGDVSLMIKKPVIWVREREELKKITLENARIINEIIEKQKDQKKTYQEEKEAILEKIEKLTDLFVDKEIDDWRWEILDMASEISAGREHSKEHFEHVISIHEKYEKLLKEYNLTNGQVAVSFELIMECYKDRLKNGF